MLTQLEIHFAHEGTMCFLLKMPSKTAHNARQSGRCLSVLFMHRYQRRKTSHRDEMVHAKDQRQHQAGQIDKSSVQRYAHWRVDRPQYAITSTYSPQQLHHTPVQIRAADTSATPRNKERSLRRRTDLALVLARFERSSNSA